MKKFAKSLPGKVLLYIGVIITFTLFAVSVAGVVIFIENGFYTKKQKQLEYDVLNSYAYSKAYQYDNAALAKKYQWFVSHGNGFLDMSDVMVFDDMSINIHDGFLGGTYSSNSSYNSYKSNPDCVLLEYYALNTMNINAAGNYKVDMLDSEYIYGGTTFKRPVKISVYVNTEKISDLYVKICYKLLPVAYSLRYAIFFIGGGALLLGVFLFVTLMWAAGRRPSDDELHPAIFEKIPYDVICGAVVALLIGMAYYSDRIAGIGELIGFAVTGGVAISMLPGLSMGFASRIKRHVLVKNTLIYVVGLFIYKILKFLLVGVYKILKSIWRWLKNIFIGIGRAFSEKSITWKAVVIIGGITLIELVYLLYSMDSVHKTHLVFMGFIIEKLILVPACFYVIVMLRRLQKSGEMLAAGELSYVTDTSKLIGDFKKHGENLNNISIGMSKSVQNSIKSERMKTELITNVSHDLKTPLTSIINYATLIGAEQSENPRINEYSEVLVRQSDKLKRLIEDLVEASKASTGNLEVNLEPCDAGVFISQVSGEFDDKFAKAELKAITKVPDYEVRILADSRRLWRVFDNLLNNICKYSMPGSRVYITLETDESNAIFTFKNTSKTELNISADELLERFVRGDSSRNTEGNGLGLSIARSLVELQKGKMDIEIDGDLFKVKITLPVM